VKAAPPGWPPLTNAHEVAPVAIVLTWIEVPAAIVPLAPSAGAPTVKVKGENGVTARLDPDGQEEMNPAARVKTPRIPSGVSKADGMAAVLEAVRMKV